MSIPNFLLTKAPGAKFTMSANPILPPFVVGSSPIVTLTGTSISNVLPSSIKAGDLLVTFVFARSTLTAPLGWTLVDSNSHTTSLTQTLYVYTKRAEVTDAESTVNYTQASSDRMSAQTIVIRGSTQVEILRHSKRTADNTSGNTTTPSQLPLAQLTGISGQRLLCTAVDVINPVNATTAWISGIVDLTQVTVPASSSTSGDQLRLCVFTKVHDSVAAINFDTYALMSGATTTTDTVGSITLELGYA